MVRDMTGKVSTPVVDIYSPRPDDLLATGQPIMLQAVARDPDRISTIEFWLDGQLLKNEKSPWPEGITPLPLAHIARIDQVGEHTLIVRAFDTQGNTGQASLLLNVVQGSVSPESRPYFVREGDTLDGIAEALGVPESDLTALNPGFSGELPPVGEELTLPAPPTEEPEVDLRPAVEPAPLLEPPDFFWDTPEVYPRWLPLPATIDFLDPIPPPPEGLLDIAILEVDAAYDGVFCYVSAGDFPVIRTPASGFLTRLEGNYWDIAEWFSGEHMLPLLVSTGSLRLRMNCVGLYYTTGGGVTQDLGVLDVTRPISEIGSGPIDERTTGAHWFRIQFRFASVGEGGGRGGTDIDYLYLDSSRWATDARPFVANPHVLLEFRLYDEGRYLAPPVVDGFIIFRNGALWRTTGPFTAGYPVWDHLYEAGGCGDQTEFHVVGYQGDADAPTATIESNHILVSGYCPPDERFRQVTVQFSWLRVICLRYMESLPPPGASPGVGIGCGYAGAPECTEEYVLDYAGCSSALDNYGPVSYGGLNVNGRRVIEMAGGIIQFAPQYYYFPVGPWQPYYRYSLSLSEADSLTITSDLWDYDVFSADDPICPGSIVLSPEQITDVLQTARTERLVQVLGNTESTCGLSLEVSAVAVSP
jgi:LysM repeat protein